MTTATLARKIREALDGKRSHCGQFNLRFATTCNVDGDAIQVTMFQQDVNQDIVFLALVDAGFDAECSNWQGMKTVRVAA